VVLEKDGEDHLGRSFKNEEPLERVKEERNSLKKLKIEKAKWIGNILHK
jgi:hypothetical protein